MNATTAPIRILIVDDCEEDRVTYRRLMERDGDGEYLFAEAETGIEGLSICRSEPPDCVVLDHRLPDIDGLTFLTRLFDEARGVPLPVIMLTGDAESALGLEAVRRGAQDFLIKGETGSGVLVRAVKHAIERHGWFEEQARRRAWRERNLSARADLFRATMHGIVAGEREALLRESRPADYDRIQAAYLDLTDLTRAGGLFDDAQNVSDGLRLMAEELATLNAGPRDVLELHVASLTKLAAASVTPPPATGDDARLMALELMGHLMHVYREARSQREDGAA